MFNIGKHCISKYLLAPMASSSEMPFRIISLNFGAGLATTKLIPSIALANKNKIIINYLKLNNNIKPISVQLFGNNSEIMAQASIEAVNIGAEIIDINMGCPVKKIVKTGAGAALMNDIKLACEIIRKIKYAIGDKIPITVKMRSGWDENSKNAVTLSKALENEGVTAIAIHGRTKAQLYSGLSDWNIIKKVKESIRIPVIGNGDIRTPDCAKKMLKDTNCDAVMIGRYALGNPWIFKALKDNISEYIPTNHERLKILLEHLDIHIKFYKLTKKKHINVNRSIINSFKLPLILYLKGLSGISIFRKKGNLINTIEELRSEIFYFLKEKITSQ